MSWQISSDPQRGALCGDVAMPSFGRALEQHREERSYLARRQR